MSLTRKHYVAIAKIIADNGPWDEDTEYAKAVKDCQQCISVDLCDYFKSDNPNFDRVKFLEACKGRTM